MKKPILKCNFCGNAQLSRFYERNDHLVVCNHCGLVSNKSQMSLEAMKNFYNEDYFVCKKELEKGYRNYFEDRVNITRTSCKRMDIILKCSSFNKGKLLDVGCASGFFLEVARQRGWEVYGVDVSHFCKEYAKNNLAIHIESDLFLNVPYEDDFFEVVTMWDYLEHSMTPRQDLLKAKKILKKKGLLIIATPDISSIPSRISKENWIGIKLEEHFYYFSKMILTNFLREQGFSILKTGYIGKYVSSSMVAERLKYYNKFIARLFKSFLTRINFSFYCNPFDIFFIICKK